MPKPIGMLADTASASTFAELITPRWAMETKWDGFRMLAVGGGDGPPAGYNRKGERAVLPANVTAEMRSLATPAILDGEYANGVYHVFDLLELDGDDQRSLPWARRNLNMRQLLDRWSPADAVIQRVEFVREGADKLALLREIEATGGEGSMFKRIDSPYEPGPSRSRCWLKYKLLADVDVVIVGAGHEGKANFTIAMADPDGDLVLPDGSKGREVGRVDARHKSAKGAGIGSVVSVRVTGLGATGRLVEPRHPTPRTDKTPAECTIAQLDTLRKISR